MIQCSEIGTLAPFFIFPVSRYRKRAYARKGGTPEHIARPTPKKQKAIKKKQLCLTQADRFAKIAFVLSVLKFERVEIVVILA